METRRPLANLFSVLASTVSVATGCADIEAIEAPTALENLSETERARVELGQRLFFDTGLSADGSVACASCHVPTEAGVDGFAVSIGVEGQHGRRNAPTVINIGFKQLLFWDGRASTLEEQALMPLRAEMEMAAVDEDVLAHLSADSAYVAAFEASYPNDGVSMASVAKALARYQRQLVAPSRVDAFLNGDEAALDTREQRGLDAFRADCAFCHGGPGVGGEEFQKLGREEPWPAERSKDLGRYEVTGDEDDKLVFAVPQLRNVGRTAPYFHDGSVETLAEAVRLMGKHQVGVDFTDAEVADLEAFLNALSADPDARLLMH